MKRGGVVTESHSLVGRVGNGSRADDGVLESRVTGEHEPEASASSRAPAVSAPAVPALASRVNALLRQIVDLTPNVVVVKDRHGRCVFANQAAADLYGTTVNALIGNPCPHLGTDAANIERMRAAELEVMDSLTELVIPEQQVTDGRGRPRWLQVTLRPVLDEAGDGPREAASHLLLWVGTDITQRKDAETARAELHERLRQSQKIEAIGLLAGGVAHDFNNLLTPIILNAEMMLASLSSGAPHRSEVEEMLSAALGAKALTTQLMAFGRKQVLAVRTVDMNDELRQATRLLSRLIPETIHFELALDARPCHVEADPAQLQQVLVNLVINARDAMPSGGCVELGTRRVTERGSQGAPTTYVLVWVRDTGVGMDDETRRRIFEPFFTTKALGRGTGLGLSTVQGIVEQHAGLVRVESELGAGTTFEIRLPFVEAERSAPTRHSRPVRRSGAAVDASSVLVVDDDPLLRRMLRELLAAQGYEVFAAEDAHDALRWATARTTPVSLLLTDVVLPRMSGQALFEALAMTHPALGVVYMSSLEKAVTPAPDEPPGVVLRKPFSVPELYAKVRRALR